jgi:low temperature requirement protein LtrA
VTSSGTAALAALRRDRSGEQRVTNIELFFDLVAVFAVTQLSSHLLAVPTPAGAFQAVLLLAMVWLSWAYTTWVTNWLDPDQIPVRLLLIALMLVSLVMAASLPRAFGDLGIWVGGAYAVMQVGRSLFMVAVLRGDPLRVNFERILCWCLVSSSLAIAGGLVHGNARWPLWLLSAGVDIAGGLAGFWTPRLGRSLTSDWTISGSHFAERCQAFILIALGESIVRIGEALAEHHTYAGRVLLAFVIAFTGSVAMWWLYFDRAAGDAATVIAASADPGRLGRNAYHLIHPVMVAGIIVTAAADQAVVSQPAEVASVPTAWMLLGGPALYLAGLLAFKFVVWRRLPLGRAGAIVVLALLAPAARSVPEVALAACAAAVVIAAAVTDYLPGLTVPAAARLSRPYGDILASGGTGRRWVRGQSCKLTGFVRLYWRLVFLPVDRGPLGREGRLPYA